MNFKVKFEMDSVDKIIAKRNLDNVQKFVDLEVLRKTDPYVPMDKGTLKSSGTRHTVIGSGNVKYQTPYARRMYYNPSYNFQGSPMRGAYWFERMKTDHKQSILTGAARMAGAKIW